MELGLATFADIAPDLSPEQRMRNLLEEAELADQLGLDLFAIGEHHRPDLPRLLAGRRRSAPWRSGPSGSGSPARSPS